MTDWTSITVLGLQDFWQGFLVFIPKLILALIVFIIGWLFSAGIGRLIQEILKRLQLDKISQMKRWSEALEKAEFETKPSEFIGAICKWILIIVFLSIAVEILGLNQFSVFLNKIIAWLPNLLAAVLIFVATVIIAHFAEKLARASFHGAKVSYGRLGGAIVKWAIWIFGIAAILLQLGIAERLILVLFQGFVALIAIAGGLAFGLGGKEVAAELWKDIRDKLRP